jgi:hypothetical protein
MSLWCPRIVFLLALALLGLLNRPALAQAQCGSAAACGTSQHTITVQNNCAYPVWLANAANVVGGSVVGGKACTATSDCCVTLPDGTSDCTGVNCASGFCTQINCTKNSDCPSSSSGLVSCNVPQGVQCGSDADCATFACTANSDCPPGATCNGTVCTGMCQSNVCACKAGLACPGAGTVCDAKSGTSFGFCAGGACQYNGLVPQPASAPQWQLAAGQSATLCMPQGWGGRIWGRTGCSTVNGAFQCQTGQCGQAASGVLQCTNLSQGVSQTATGVTLFEGTWDSNATDFWDVSLVNGYNLPMTASACGSSSSTSISCLFAGQKTGASQNVGCVSDLNASCPALLTVQGQCNCVSNSDCPSGQTCGANNLCSGGSATCPVTCIDPGDLCQSFGLFANNPVIPAPSCLQCNQAVPGDPNSNTYSDFYNCLGSLATISCNNAAWVCFSDKDCPVAGQTCQSNVCTPVSTTFNSFATCTNSGGTFSCNPNVNQVAQYSCQSQNGTQLCLPSPPSSTASGCCGPFSSSWNTATKAANGTSATSCQPGTTPYTTAFKAACPTAYSYQFDDPSSSYQCFDTPGNEVNYLVTFCPAGTVTASVKGKK